MLWLEPEFCVVDGHARAGLRVLVDGDSGLIAAVEPCSSPPSVLAPVERLSGRALLPSFHNAHSHAFQRLLRGHVEDRRGVDDDFWSWRQAMYRVAENIEPEEILAVSRFVFIEMVLAGFASVGEFHYLHHQGSGTPYSDRLLLSRLVVAAAEEAGIGLCLLRTAYERAGPGLSPERAQRRFCDPDPAVMLADVEALQALRRDGPRLVRVGLAPHSVRALSKSSLQVLGEGARATSLPVHMHVAEQPREIDLCRAEHGRSPLQLLDDIGLLTERFTAVHATFLDDDAIARLGAAKASACICPTTESNLGDGLPRLRDLLDAGARLAIGTDSHSRIDPFAEIRRLEEGERLRLGRRNVLAPRDGGPTAPVVLAAGTSGGAAALGWPAPAFQPGARADLVAVRLDDPALAGAVEGPEAADSLPAALLLHGCRPFITDHWIGGRAIVRAGHHPLEAQARAAFLAVARRLRAL